MIQVYENTKRVVPIRFLFGDFQKDCCKGVCVSVRVVFIVHHYSLRCFSKQMIVFLRMCWEFFDGLKCPSCYDFESHLNGFSLQKLNVSQHTNIIRFVTFIAVSG